jgi:hypothetical protein
LRKEERAVGVNAAKLSLARAAGVKSPIPGCKNEDVGNP